MTKSQTATNMMKGFDGTPNNYYLDDKKQQSGNTSNKCMSTANL